jgi:PAS domain S-box-containing protein
MSHETNNQVPSELLAGDEWGEGSYDSLADGVMVLDQERRIVAFGEGAERITGYSRDEAVGQNCDFLFRCGVSGQTCPGAVTLSTGQPVANFHCQVFTKDDDPIPVCVNSSPIHDTQGNVSSTVLTFRNVAEVRDLMLKVAETNVRLAAEKGKLSSILNSIADGVFTVDSEYRITSFNRAAGEITGFQAEEVIGKPCHTVFRSTVCREECPLKTTVRTGEPVTNYEIEILDRHNRIKPISVSTALLRDSEGRIIGGVETFRDLSQLKELAAQVRVKYSFANIVGKSKPIQKIFQVIRDVAPTNTTVLIQGETGTGKEVVARAIHYTSPRRDMPFVAVSCAALPDSLLESELFGHVRGAFTGASSDRPGRFELADGGTLFLDEIGEVSAALQVKLLRVIETRQFERLGDRKTTTVDVRFIAATNRELQQSVAEGKFRQDLYYRLTVLSIRIPTLRERAEDVPLLVEHFIGAFNEQTGKRIRGVSQKTMDILVDSPWPGNVRQLENAIEHAFIHCTGELIHRRHLPEELQHPHPPIIERVSTRERPIDSLEKELILSALERASYRRSEAARFLGISRSSLWRKMKKHGIETR